MKCRTPSSTDCLCLLKTPKDRERLEIFAPPPYRRGHDHDSFHRRFHTGFPASSPRFLGTRAHRAATSGECPAATAPRSDLAILHGGFLACQSRDLRRQRFQRFLPPLLRGQPERGIASVIRERRHLGQECCILNRGRGLCENRIELVEFRLRFVIVRRPAARSIWPMIG